MSETARERARTRPRMQRFLQILLGFTVIVHLPFFFGAHRAAAELQARSPWSLAATLTAAGLALFVGRARAGMPDRKRAGAVLWAIDIPYYVHWCACVFAILPAAAATPVLAVVDLARGGPVALHDAFYGACYAVGVVVAAYGVLVRRRWFRVERLDVKVAGLPPSFDGYRVAQLSDLHIGALTPRSWGERWARAANREAPDLTVVTGDLVTSGVEFHEDIAAVVGGLTARDGVFVALGNHDYFGEGEPLVSLLRRAGVTVLRNEGRLLARGGDRLYLAAIDDTWTRRADLDRALSGRPDGAPTLLLAHDPDAFPEAAARAVELTLSGHTHGGQIAVPFLARILNLSRIAHRFTLGIYERGRSTLYVHPGLGTTGPPVRFGVAPAVVVLTLRRG